MKKSRIVTTQLEVAAERCVVSVLLLPLLLLPLLSPSSPPHHLLIDRNGFFCVCAVIAAQQS